MLRRCVRELSLIPSVRRRVSRQVPFFLSSRNGLSTSTNWTTKSPPSAPPTPPPPPPPEAESDFLTRKNILIMLLGGGAIVGAGTTAYFQFKGKDTETQKDLKTSEESKSLEASMETVEDTNTIHSPPMEVEVEGKNSEIQPSKDQLPVPGDSKPEMISQDTLPIIDDQAKDSTPLSQDGQTFDSKEVIVKQNVENDVQNGNVGSDVVSVESGTSAAPPTNTPQMEVPKDAVHIDGMEQKSLAETYLLQEVEVPQGTGSSGVEKLEAAKVEKKSSNEKPALGTAREEQPSTGSSDEGKVVFDIIEAIHAAERKQAELDASKFLEEKKKLKEKYEKELKDTRARELMYAEEAATLEKELTKEKVKATAAIKAHQEKAEQNLREELQRKEEEANRKLEMIQELAKAELAAAIAKEKATQIEQIAEADLNIDALCMAFYARSEEARQSHSVHKLALGTLALEEALSNGLPIRAEVDSLRQALDSIDKDSLLELALSSLPEEVLDQGAESPLKLEEKFDSLKGTLRHYSLIPAGAGGLLAHAVAHVASSIKVKEDDSGEGVEALITRVEKLLANGDLAAAAEALEGGLNGSEAEEYVTEWVTRARGRAIAEQTLTLLHSYASSITFS